MIARLIAPYSSVSGKTTAPNSQSATSAVVNMPDRFGRTLVRSFVVPANPQTAAQIQIRGWMTSVSEAMQTLSQPQVEQWQALADEIERTGRLGVDYRLNWNQLFSQVNSYRLQRGQGINLTPPTLTLTPLPSGITEINSDDGDPVQLLEITTADTYIGNQGWIAIRITRDLASPNRQARSNELRYVADPTVCIFPRGTNANPTFTINTSRLNILAGQFVGVEATILNAQYVLVGRIFIKNLTVQTQP